MIKSAGQRACKQNREPAMSNKTFSEVKLFIWPDAKIKPQAMLVTIKVLFLCLVQQMRQITV